MELQFSRTTGMLIVFLVTITAVLTEFYSSTDNTTRPPTHVLKPRNDRKTKTTRTMNTMQNLNSEEGPGKWIYRESGINTKKTMAGTKSQAGTNMGKDKFSTTDNSIKDKNTMQKGNWIYRESGINTKKTTPGTISQAGTNMGKDEFSTTDNSIKDTKNEQENLSYSTVPTMHSAYSTYDSTELSHHQDNSEHIGIIVRLTVSLFLLLVVVVGLVFLCYKKFLCFKRNEKCDLGMSSSPMLDEEKIQTEDMTVNGDVILMMVDSPMLNEKNKTPDMSGDEDNVDIKTEDERYLVRTKDKPIIKSLKSLNSIQPSDASE